MRKNLEVIGSPVNKKKRSDRRSVTPSGDWLTPITDRSKTTLFSRSHNRSVRTSVDEHFYHEVFPFRMDGVAVTEPVITELRHFHHPRKSGCPRGPLSLAPVSHVDDVRAASIHRLVASPEQFRESNAAPGAAQAPTLDSQERERRDREKESRDLSLRASVSPCFVSDENADKRVCETALRLWERETCEERESLTMDEHIFLHDILESW